MRKVALLLVAAALLFSSARETLAFHHYQSGGPNRPIVYQPWHGGYANTQWGRPVALVVPPNARFETTWGWGVGHSEMYPITAQYGRNDPGAGGGYFAPTPTWPSHTEQFGTYYIRGPR